MHIGNRGGVARLGFPDVDRQRVHNLLTIAPHRPIAR
jgi:hypothetical protein